jgi:ATP-binding cassette subfamily F protein 3
MVARSTTDGTVKTFDGDMDEYRRFVLDQARAESRKNAKPGDEDEPKDTLAAQRQNNAKTRRETAPLRKKIEAVEARMAKFAGLITKVDDMLAHPDAYAKDPAKAAQLAQQRAELVRALAGAEEEWLALSEELEAASA